MSQNPWERLLTKGRRTGYNNAVIKGAAWLRTGFCL